jgi:hypothetical protein
MPVISAPAKKTAPKSATKKTAVNTTTDIAAGYNQYKNYNGQQYTGMQIGKTHKWYYDKGVWRERKVTPDMWEITYSVVKRRAGKAPEGSGVPVGTGYHWFILSHQFVHKLDANDYSTAMVGLKLKVAHKRADKGRWNISEATKRNHLIKMLKEFITELEKQPQKTEIVPLEFIFKNKQYTGMAVPMMAMCHDGVCNDLDVTLNDEHYGVIRNTSKGWRMTDVKSQAFVNAIGDEIMAWYE